MQLPQLNNLFKWRAPVYIFILLFFMPILISMSIQWYLSVSRPVISIESIVAAFFVFLSYKNKIFFNILYVVLYIPTTSAQLIEPIAIRFGQRLPDSYYMLIGGAGALPIAVLGGLGAAFVIYILFMYLINRKAFSNNSIEIYWVVVFILALVLYDVLFSANRFYPKEIFSAPNILGAPILNSQFDRRRTQLSFWSVEPTSYSVLRGLISNRKSVLVVSFESLGLPFDEGEKSRIDQLIVNSFPKYMLKTVTTEQFVGGTLSGELRVLCGIKTFGSILSEPKDFISSFQGCLPRMASTRYNYAAVIAAHANYSGLYRRSDIYPMMGFAYSIFASDLESEEIQSCGSRQFAACDAQITRALSSYLNSFKHTPSFTYIMTIDSHFPYSSPIAYGIEKNNIFELYISSLKSTSDALKSYLNSLSISPEVILVSGDHSPPFISDSARKKFDQQRVPVYVLELMPSR